MKLLAGRFAGTILVYCALRQPVNALNAVPIGLANDLAHAARECIDTVW